MEAITYPIRINRYLALKKICSRREADRFIEQGNVIINRRTAQLGDMVQDGDTVRLNKLARAKTRSFIYLAYNKPQGIITHSPQRGEKDIKKSARPPHGVFPIGRLDKASHGLIILTNDGRVTDALLHPRHEHEKEYIVKTDKPVTPFLLRHINQGIKLEDVTTKPCITKQMGAHTFRITLTEGKKHQIRRMCAALGWQTQDIYRIRIMNIRLGDTKQNEFRAIEGDELKKFLNILGLGGSSA